jgi:hypothetical protein
MPVPIPSSAKTKDALINRVHTLEDEMSLRTTQLSDRLERIRILEIQGVNKDRRITELEKACSTSKPSDSSSRVADLERELAAARAKISAQASQIEELALMITAMGGNPNGGVMLQILPYTGSSASDDGSAGSGVGDKRRREEDSDDDVTVTKVTRTDDPVNVNLVDDDDDVCVDP